jgi:hypothetical protein
MVFDTAKFVVDLSIGDENVVEKLVAPANGADVS